MKKLLFSLIMLASAFTLGNATCKVTTTCGRIAYTVCPAFFECNETAYWDYIFTLDDDLCGVGSSGWVIVELSPMEHFCDNW